MNRDCHTTTMEGTHSYLNFSESDRQESQSMGRCLFNSLEDFIRLDNVLLLMGAASLNLKKSKKVVKHEA